MRFGEEWLIRKLRLQKINSLPWNFKLLLVLKAVPFQRKEIGLSACATESALAAILVILGRLQFYKK